MTRPQSLEYWQTVPSVQAQVPAVEQQGTPAVHRGHADTSQLVVAGVRQRIEGPGIDDTVVPAFHVLVQGPGAAPLE